MNDEYLHQLYQRDGVLFPLTALSEAETAVAQRQYMEMCPPGCVVADREQRLFGHFLYPWVADLVSHPNVLKVVRSLIGPNVLVWVSEFNAKAPDTNHYFSWHQDLFYWRHQCENVSTIPMVTAWMVSGEDTFGQWQHVAPIYAKQGLALRDKCMDSVQRMTGNPFK